MVAGQWEKTCLNYCTNSLLHFQKSVAFCLFWELRIFNSNFPLSRFNFFEYFSLPLNILIEFLQILTSNFISVFLYCWRLLFVQCWYNKTCLEATLAPALLWYCISPSQFFFPSITLFGVYTLLTPVGNLSFKILHKTAQNRNSKHHVVAGKKTHKEENIYNNKHKTF